MIKKIEKNKKKIIDLNKNIKNTKNEIKKKKKDQNNFQKAKKSLKRKLETSMGSNKKKRKSF